jgi:hypothetical protein
VDYKIQFPAINETEYSFIGCPQQLSRLLKFMSAQRVLVLSSELCDNNFHIIQHIAAALSALQEFDCVEWANSLTQQYPGQSCTGLSYLAQVYKMVIQIYGKRILSVCTGGHLSQEEEVDEVIRLMHLVYPDEDLFKCTLWPLFIAGVESRRVKQRESILTSLDRLWQTIYCYNVKNAVKVLQTLWQKQGQENSVQSSHWMLELGNIGLDWLFV